MRFTTAIYSAITALMAGQTMAAAIETPANEARAALVATDPYYACNCPNNCSYKQGHSCRYYSGPSSDSSVISGTCQTVGGGLTCIGKA